jgi:hypothetical protein
VSSCRFLSLILITCALASVGCGGSGATPFSVAAAKRPFVVGGFDVGCPGILLPAGVIQDLGIARHSAADACSPNLGALTVYRSTAEARSACAPSDKYFCGPFQYQIRNVVLALDTSSRSVRSELLKAFRTLGTPTRIA